MENEIKLLESNIANEKTIIANLKTDTSKQTPEIETKKSKKQELESITQESQKKLDALIGEVKVNEAKKADLERELLEKESTLANKEAEIDSKVASNQSELDQAEASFNAIVDDNQIWDFLFKTMESPEIEIMAIISLQRNISTDTIKSQAKSVSPVFVGRSLGKLESDGKIVQTPEGNWDLSPELLNVIG